MKTRKNRTLTIVIIIILSITLIGFGGYFYLLNSLKSAISGCELQTKQFTETINFEYVDNWIVIKVKIEGSDKEYPFFFDTGPSPLAIPGTISVEQVRQPARAAPRLTCQIFADHVSGAVRWKATGRDST